MRDGTPMSAESDGYGTGLMILGAHGRPGVASAQAQIAKGLAWLERNQETAGAWRATSMNKQRDPASDAGKVHERRRHRVFRVRPLCPVAAGVMSAALPLRGSGPRLPDHLHQHAPGIVAARYLSQEGHAPAINPLTRLQPQVEPEAIHGGHRSLVGGLARIVPGDQP